MSRLAQQDRYALIVARFYADLAERLVARAADRLEQAGAGWERFDVPGAFELPLAAAWALKSGRFAAAVCLGAVIRGETDHYHHVCVQAAQGIQRVALESGLPCAFGLLTCATYEQALARADGSRRDQGALAAEAALTMVALRRELVG